MVNQLLIQSDKEALQAIDLGTIQIYIYSKRLGNQVRVTTIIKEQGQPKKQFIKSKKVNNNV